MTNENPRTNIMILLGDSEFPVTATFNDLAAMSALPRLGAPAGPYPRGATGAAATLMPSNVGWVDQSVLQETFMVQPP